MVLGSKGIHIVYHKSTSSGNLFYQEKTWNIQRFQTHPKYTKTISNPSKTTKKHSETKPHPPTPKKKHGPYMVFFFFAYKSCFFFWKKKLVHFCSPLWFQFRKTTAHTRPPRPANGRVDALPVAPQRSPSHRVGSWEIWWDVFHRIDERRAFGLAYFSHHFSGCLGGGFKYFFFHPEPWGNDAIWLIFFKWVETTNYIYIYIYVLYTFFMYIFSMYVYMHIATEGVKYFKYCLSNDVCKDDKETNMMHVKPTSLLTGLPSILSWHIMTSCDFAGTSLAMLSNISCQTVCEVSSHLQFTAFLVNPIDYCNWNHVVDPRIYVKMSHHHPQYRSV